MTLISGSNRSRPYLRLFDPAGYYSAGARFRERYRYENRSISADYAINILIFRLALHTPFLLRPIRIFPLFFPRNLPEIRIFSIRDTRIRINTLLRINDISGILPNI